MSWVVTGHHALRQLAKKKPDNADTERFFVDEDYLNKDAMVERAPVTTSWE